jgi:uncharacterized membrane protein
MQKKGLTMSLNVIIIIVILLAVSLVLIMIVFNTANDFKSKSTDHSNEQITSMDCGRECFKCCMTNRVYDSSKGYSVCNDIDIQPLCGCKC